MLGAVPFAPSNLPMNVNLLTVIIFVILYYYKDCIRISIHYVVHVQAIYIISVLYAYIV